MTRAKAPALTEAEEARIQAGIAADPDAAEATDAQLAQMKPASKVLPAGLYAALTGRVPSRGEPLKVQLTLRLDPRIVDAYRATGPGWQARMGAVLAEGLKHRGGRS